MSHILKKCPCCEKYSDITVETCSCGKDLTSVLAKKVDETIQDSQINEISDAVQVYEQKCPSCKKIFYLYDKDLRYKKCPNCRKIAISNQEPVLVYPEIQEIKETSDDNLRTEIKVENHEEIAQRIDIKQKNQSSLGWGGLLEKIKKDTSDQQGEVSQVVAETPKKKSTEIVLKCIGGKQNVEIAFGADEAPILLGRYVLDSIDPGDKKEKRYQLIEQILAGDRRVSSYHCHLKYKDGSWFVSDGSWSIPEKDIPQKRSTNSTKVNEKVVDNEVQLLNDDILKLGNQKDSILFAITVK